MAQKSRKRSQSQTSRRKAARQDERHSDKKRGSGHGFERRRSRRDEDRTPDALLFERLLMGERARTSGQKALEPQKIVDFLEQAAASTRRRLLAMTGGSVGHVPHQEGTSSALQPGAKARSSDVSAAVLPQFVPSRSYRTERNVGSDAAKETEKEVATGQRGRRVKPQGLSQPPQAAQNQELPTQASSRSTLGGGHQPDGSDSGIPGLKLDSWQQKALDLLLAGRHVIVDAPTSAGKTRVIEALLDAKMESGLRLIYTSPVKSLSNDKYREFAARYGKDRVGINTGDFKENLGAPIILATLETYRNSLLGLEPDMSRRVVVYDEYHYLQDESRGSAWEESIILTPASSQLILLSASVPNAEEFADWIKRITSRHTEVVRVEKRPVPLVDVVYTAGGWVLAEDFELKPKEVDLLASAYVQERRRSRRGPRDRQFYAELLDQVVRALDCDLGPVIVYAARRAEVETLASAFMRAVARPGAAAWEPKAKALLLERTASLSGWEYVPSELQSMVTRQGVAYHHSGMIPPARVAIESLLKEGLLRVCMGTMGISLGVNFAVRSAFIADDNRPGESGEKTYSNSEVLQMLGRAGRRGHDVQGFSLWSDLGKYARFKPKERERCVSSLKFDPSTVLGLIDRTNNYALVADFYKKSLFMQGQPASRVLVFDQTVLSAEVYRASGGLDQACQDIPATFLWSLSGKRRSAVPCSHCPSKSVCHSLAAQSRSSLLQQIVGHLEEVGAVADQKLTDLGQFARHFPQSGGLLIASWLASGAMNGDTFSKYVQALAVFCSAHFKEIPPLLTDRVFLGQLRIDTEIEFYYPSDLFPEYYDDIKGRVQEHESPLVFRELNFGAPSIVQMWLNPSTVWEDMVERHTTRFFSAGDCMMVLFRFATYLQSCSRLIHYDRKLAHEAKRMLGVILREPLDARNRMLLEEVEDEERLDAETPAVDAGV